MANVAKSSRVRQRANGCNMERLPARTRDSSPHYSGRRSRRLCKRSQGVVDAAQRLGLAQDSEAIEQARTDRDAGDGDAQHVIGIAELNPVPLAEPAHARF